MPKFAANLSTLFTELPFLDRFGAAARAGFAAVECQFPYALEARELADRLRRYRLVQVLHNLPAGDLAAGERGIACLPDRIDEFRAGVSKGLEYARALGCTRLNCLVGLTPAGEPEDRVQRTLLENLRYAAALLGDAGIRLLIEPINTFDVPGFYLSGSGQAAALIEASGVDNIYLQYDAYHMQRMEGSLTPTMRRYLPRIAHVQIADAPGRHEPGSGEIDFPAFFASLDRMGYDGWVGCEYRPAATTSAGLAWLAPYLGGRSSRRE